jgi:two-component system, OmpR family, copper resistance phosphate regulon response regulator CusR
MSSVLIAEGEPRIASFVKLGLDAHGFTTRVATDGDEAVALSRRLDFDLVVLDAALVRLRPTLLSDLRGRRAHVPVVMLTKRDLVDTLTDPDGVPADDYIRKPFRFGELLAKITDRLRLPDRSDPTVVSRHGATYDRQRRRLTMDGRTIELTAREADVVDLIFRGGNRALTRDQLLRRLRIL